jgi:hypothetical protein
MITEADMSKPFDEWTVQPHGKLTQVADTIWSVVGAIRMPLLSFPRRMTVVQLRDRRLVIYSAIALDDEQMVVLRSLGDPTYLIVPNDHHRLDARAWKRRFPSIVVAAPAGAREKVEDTVHVDTVAPDFADPSVQFATVLGTGDKEAALIVHNAAGTTLVLNDVIGNMPDEPGFRGWMLRTAGFAGEDARIPTVAKLGMIEDRDALRSQLETWSEMTDLTRVIVSHGNPIDQHPRQTLRRLAGSLA